MASRRGAGVHPLLRGFTLLEAMVVVAILGILAALATPAFLPILRDQELRSTAEMVTAFFHGARMRAIADRRCTRVILAAGTPTVLVGQVLNTFDCGDSLNTGELPSNAPAIDSAAAGHWIEFARVRVDRTSVTVAWQEVPTGGDPHADTADTEDEVRYRPSGRIFSDDTDLTNDDGVVQISSAATGNSFSLLLEGHGPLCLLPRNVPPPGSGNNRSCP